MAIDMLEDFLERMDKKSHIKELLPVYTLNCCLQSEEGDHFFVLSKHKISQAKMLNPIDIIIEAPFEILNKALAGYCKLTDERIRFHGSYRQFLLLESIITLSCRAKSFAGK